MVSCMNELKSFMQHHHRKSIQIEFQSNGKYTIMYLKWANKKKTFLVWVYARTTKFYCDNLLNKHNVPIQSIFTQAVITRETIRVYFLLHLLLTDLFGCMFGSQNSFACPFNFIQWLIIWMILPLIHFIGLLSDRVIVAHTCWFTVYQKWQPIGSNSTHKRALKSSLNVYSLIDKSSVGIICFVFIISNNLLLLFTQITLDTFIHSFTLVNLPLLSIPNKLNNSVQCYRKQ